MRSIVLLLSLFGVCLAQNSAEKEGTIKVQVRRVPVDVIVTDSHGQPVKDLKKEDFTLLENKVSQEITGFSAETVQIMPPFHLCQKGSSAMQA